jgi:hypothetical protein
MYGPRLPYSDDWDLVPIITGRVPLTLGWLWAQHNEHRIVIPKLVSIILYRATSANFRSVIYLNIVLLSLLSAASILTMRKIRGRILFIDAFYPLLLMHLGQSAFFWGFELQFTLVTSLVCSISLVAIYSGQTLKMPSTILIGLLLLLLPVSGGNGLLYVPGIALWLGIRAFCQLKNLAKQEATHVPSDSNTYRAVRRAQIIMLGFVAMSMAISIAYFVGYKRVPHPWPAATMKQLAAATLHLLAAAFGWFPTAHLPLFAIASAILTVASFAYVTFLSFHPETSPILRWRASDIAACMMAFVPVALGLAYGRGGQSSFPTSHYSTLALPILYWTFMSFSLGIRRPAAKFIQIALCLMLSFLWITYAYNAVQRGKSSIINTAEIERELSYGATIDEIVDHHILELIFIDTPETRKLVKVGIEDFRRAGFSQYGPGGKTD